MNVNDPRYFVRGFHITGGSGTRDGFEILDREKNFAIVATFDAKIENAERNAQSLVDVLNGDDLRERLETSEAALDWLLDRFKSYMSSIPVRDMDEAVSFAENALKPFHMERMIAERNEVLAAGGKTIDKQELAAAVELLNFAIANGHQVPEHITKAINTACRMKDDED